MNWQMVVVFSVILTLVTMLGFWAARWQSGDLNRLQEWGLAGRRFGTVLSWFVIGGDVYSATTFIAWPGVIYAQGAIGFWAVPFAILMYLVLFSVMPRFWIVSKHRGYVTAADFVRERFDSNLLTLLVAITGVMTTMPYIALQIIGVQIPLALMGVPVEVALLIAFGTLAAYTYVGGLRAPAVIAIVKDVLIWLVVIVAIISIPSRLGGFGPIFAKIPQNRLLLDRQQYSTYATLILGSTFAVFLHPHILTGVLSANSSKALKHNAILLPAYTVLLAMICLLSFVAVAAGLAPSPVYRNDIAFSALFPAFFPPWFAGIALAAIALASLVPAAIMAIAAANLFTRNIYRAYLRPTCNEREESRVARFASLAIKFGALVFVLFFPSTFAVNLQLFSSTWILQTLPAVFLGLYTNWFHRYALIMGWLVGMALGTWMVVEQGFSLTFPVSFGGQTLMVYSALLAIGANLVVTVALTPLLRLLGVPAGREATSPEDFEARPAHSFEPSSVRAQPVAPPTTQFSSSFSLQQDQSDPGFPYPQMPFSTSSPQHMGQPTEREDARPWRS